MSCSVAYLCQSSLRYVYATNSEASYTHVLSRPSHCREVRIVQIASCFVSRVRRTHIAVCQRLHTPRPRRVSASAHCRTGPTHSRRAACCCDLLPCFTESCRPSNIDTRDPQPISVVAKSKVRNFTQARSLIPQSHYSETRVNDKPKCFPAFFEIKGPVFKRARITSTGISELVIVTQVGLIIFLSVLCS